MEAKTKMHSSLVQTYIAIAVAIIEKKIPYFVLCIIIARSPYLYNSTTNKGRSNIKVNLQCIPKLSHCKYNIKPLLKTKNLCCC